MPNRTDFEVVLVKAKRGFRLRQLDVRRPQFFIASVRYIAAKQVAACTQSRPVASCFDFLREQGDDEVFLAQIDGGASLQSAASACS